MVVHIKEATEIRLDDELADVSVWFLFTRY